jgi:Domain of unknown function (DUF4384)/Caspase domain
MISPRVKRPSGRFTTCLVLALATIGALSDEALAQNPPPPIDQQMVNQRPEFLVRAWVDKKYNIYAEGESVTLKVRCEQDAYLYVLYQEASGKVYQIFPNGGQPDNRIKAMKDVQIPEPDDDFRWVVAAPFGPEVIKVIASKKPIDALTIPGVREDHFTPISGTQLDAAGQQVGKEPANSWSEHDLKILTVAKGESTVPVEPSKRYAVFFGVSTYEFNDQYMQVQRDVMKKEAKVDEEAIHPLNLRCPINDAKDMAQKFKEVGQLADAKVLLNSEVTRDKMREMITEWLPKVSKPGDTVFLYFSGHGSQVPDDNGDEKDGLDEVLSPFDTMGPAILFMLRAQAKAGNLDPALSQRVNKQYMAASEYYDGVLAKLGGKQAPGALEKADKLTALFVINQTSVNDDDMGHWVQKLDGRRVVVILDACRSGGMTNIEERPTKGTDDGPRRKRGFDFLSGEFARLKDLNQPSLTLIAAATDKEDSVEFGRDRNGIFTKAILELLAGSEGPVDARQVIENAKVVLAARAEEVNGRIDAAIKANPQEKEKLEKQKFEPFTPTLFTTDTQPVYLKP